MRFIVVLLVLLSGCANVKYTLRDEDPKKGKKSSKVIVDYSGTASGARELVDAATRRDASAAAGDVARTAAEKGLPTSLNATGTATGVQTGGYFYGAYGMYGAYPYAAFGVSPQTMAAEAASFGSVPGYLPRLAQPVVTTAPSSTQLSIGEALCPVDRLPITLEERIACLRKDQDALYRTVRPGKRK